MVHLFGFGFHLIETVYCSGHFSVYRRNVECVIRHFNVCKIRFHFDVRHPCCYSARCAWCCHFCSTLLVTQKIGLCLHPGWYPGGSRTVSTRESDPARRYLAVLCVILHFLSPHPGLLQQIGGLFVCVGSSQIGCKDHVQSLNFAICLYLAFKGPSQPFQLWTGKLSTLSPEALRGSKTPTNCGSWRYNFFFTSQCQVSVS